AKSFQDPSEALSSAETEIYYLPEFFYWDGFTPTSVGCTYGGTLYFDSNDDGTKYNFQLNRCEFTSNFKMTGLGLYDTENDRFTLAVKTTGRWKCDLVYDRKGEEINVVGKCNGKSINRDLNDLDIEQHRVPNLKEVK
ncbi:MAG TPA: hypothetical protein VFQ13_04580, partial [Anaerolineales bacterium]|nr:hypothetical protein [Anaerolineales bacterium]